MSLFNTFRVLRGGDDPAPQSGVESTDAMMAALIKNLPDLTRVTGENILPLEQARINASRAITPQENQLALDTYRQFGPILNQIGNQISRDNQLAAVGSDAATLAKANETGLVDAALALQRKADPEFYKMREALGRQGTSLLESFGGAGLSGSESEEIARGLNRTNVAGGVNDIGSPTAAIRNAMTFGQAGQNRRNSLAQALATTSQAMQGTKSGFDPFQVATGRSAFSGNTGENKFAGSQTSGLGQNTMGLTTNLLSQAGENQRLSQNINSQRRDSLDRFGATFGTVMNGIGAVTRPGCWVAREVYGDCNPRWRLFRVWLMSKAPRWFYNLYMTRGEWFASKIKDKPKIKALIRRWMDSRIAVMQ